MHPSNLILYFFSIFLQYEMRRIVWNYNTHWMEVEEYDPAPPTSIIKRWGRVIWRPDIDWRISAPRGIPPFLNLSLISEYDVLPVRARVDLDRESSFASEYIFRRLRRPLVKKKWMCGNGIMGVSPMIIQWNWDIAIDQIYCNPHITHAECLRGVENSAKFIVGRKILRYLHIIKA